MSQRSTPRRTIVGLSLLGAGVIHLAAIRTHREAPMAVATFLGIGLAQMLVGAGWMTAAPLRLLRLAAAAVTVPALVAWLVSRTIGLPGWSGHHVGPEATGLGDVMAVGLQIVALAVAVVPLRALRGGTPRPSSHLAAVLVSAVLTVIGAFGTASVSGHDDGPGHHGVARENGAPVVRSTRRVATPLADPAGPPLDAAEPGADSHGPEDSPTPHGH